MCGRFPQRMTNLELILRITGEDGLSWDYQPNVNTAPGSILPVLCYDNGFRIVPTRWGFVPSWSKEEIPKTRPINAKAENLQSSGMWRSAFSRHRGVTESDGFFEWDQNFPRGKRPAYWIRRRDRRPTLLACLTAERIPAEEVVERTTAIITTEPNDLVRRLHNRQPVFIEPTDVEEWLDPERRPEDLARFFRPSPAELYEAVPISRAIGNVHNTGRDLLEPTGEILQT